MALDPVTVQPTTFPYARRYLLEDTAGKVRAFTFVVPGSFRIVIGPVYQSDGTTLDGAVLSVDQTVEHGDVLDVADATDDNATYRLEDSGQIAFDVKPRARIRTIFVGPLASSLNGVVSIQVEAL